MIGKLLTGFRAGDAHLFRSFVRGPVAPIVLSSSAFADGHGIPTRYAGKGLGQNLSPLLEWTSTQGYLAIVMQGPDAPVLRPVLHLVATGITGRSLSEGALNFGSTQAILGKGSFGRVGYARPRPLKGHGVHRYIFQIAAVDKPLLGTYDDLVAAAKAGQILASGELTGTYAR